MAEGRHAAQRRPEFRKSVTGVIGRRRACQVDPARMQHPVPFGEVRRIYGDIVIVGPDDVTLQLTTLERA
ncbi:hypothetical protein AB0C28_08860 [Nonomuraea sp. NPDC048892]|uniref:hypothetical protein n=1 Tax=Nonomuraea sp. NPDC048892 TaxID=3154624 RepID=UPI0033C38D89